MKRWFLSCMAFSAISLVAPVQAADKGYELKSGQSLLGASDDTLAAFQTRFVMQHDCNLVVYRNDKAVWATNTNGKGGGCRLDMQTDGNLVIYRAGDNKVVWASNTPRNPGAHLITQTDGNVVIYQGMKAIWSTGTWVRPRKIKVGERPTTGKFVGCAFARTETKCVVAVQLCKAVYACGFNPGSLSPIEKSESWGPCGACFGVDF